jgi:DNA-binding NarL/FixJ family response regulator
MVTAGIVEDQAGIREGLIALLEESARFRCLGAWGSMEEALAALEPRGATLPDVVLVDLGLPGMAGTEGIRRLKTSRPELLTVVLTVHEDDERIFDALCAGACGYLLKKTPAPRLLAGLEEAVAGGAPMSPEIARRVVGLFSRLPAPARADYGLTPHEMRVLKLLVEGRTYKDAAAALKVSTPTVAFHVRRIYEKLQVHSRSQAVAKALREDVLR